MILTEKILIKSGTRSTKRYLDLGYKPNEDGYFEVNPLDLPPCSQQKVEVQCDTPGCNTVKTITYHAYHMCIEKHGFYKCRLCGNEDAKKTMLKRYGVEHPAQSPEILQKIQNTNKERYGYNFVAQVPEFQEKAKQTNNKKYGVDNVLQSSIFQEQIKNTIMEKYGVDNVGKSKEIQEKIKTTNQKKYGVDYALQNTEIQEKIRETNRKKYGADYYIQTEEGKQKAKKTVQQKYGVDFVSQVPEFKEKAMQTSIGRYGTLNPTQSNEIQDKIAQTNIEKYGVPCVLSSPIIREKIKNTNQIKYGYDVAASSPIVQEKIKKSLYDNQNVLCSSQQKYIYNLYGGILNYPILCYNLDILLGNIDIEIDASGHDLCVKHNSISKEEFEHKQLVRNAILKKNGYKIMRIISCRDLFPSDKILLQMLSDAKQYFSDYPEHSWIEFNIDNKIVRNAEYNDGVSYFYGQLRRITKKDLESA